MLFPPGEFTDSAHF